MATISENRARRSAEKGARHDATPGNGSDSAIIPDTLYFDVPNRLLPPGNGDSWKKAVSGDWATAANWTSGSAPTSSTAATIAVAGTYTVTIDSSDAAQSLLIDNASATVLDTAGGYLSIGTSLTLTAGTFALSNGGGISGGTLTVASGTTLISGGGGTANSVVNSTGVISVSSGVLSFGAGGSLAGTISGAGTLAFQGGNVTSAASVLAGAANLEIDGGTLTVNGASSSAGATLSILYGNLAIASGTDLTLTSPLSFGSASNYYGYEYLTGPGTLTTTGTTTINDYAGDGYVEIFLGGGITWVNSGTVNDAGFGYMNTVNNDTVTIVNAPGATFNLTTDDAGFSPYYNGTDTFTNAGTLAKTAGTGTSALDIAVNSTGLVEVATGTLALEAGGSLSGTLGGTGMLAIAGGNVTTTIGFLGGAGNLEIDGGTLTVSGASGSASAALSILNGDLAIASGTNLTLTSPLSFGSASNYYGYADLTGPGTLTTTGTTTINDYAGDGYVEIFLGGGITWVNSGTVNDAGFGYMNTVNNDTVTIVNAAGATFNLTTDDAGFSPYYNGTDIFTNAGTLADNGGSGDTVFGFAINDTGVISITAGTLEIAGISGNGSLVLGAGATLEVGGGGSLGLNISGTGTLALSSGDFASTVAFLANAATTELDGGTLTVSGASGSASAALSILNGDLAIASGTNLTLTSPLSFGSASNYYGYEDLTGPGTLTTTGTTTINDYAGDGYVEIFLGGGITWVNSGTVNDAGFGYMNTVNNDTVTIVNAAGATFNLTTDDAGFSPYYNGTDIFTNAGTLAKIGGTGTSYLQFALNSTGIIDVASGTLALDSGGTLSGSFGGAGTLAIGEGNFASIVGFLGGTGNLEVAGGTITVSGASGNAVAAVSILYGDFDIASGTDLTLTGPLSFGSANNFYGLEELTGPGTLTTTGTTTINDYNGDPAIYLGGGLTWINSGTVNDAGYGYLNTLNSDTVTILNQVGAIFNLTTNDASLNPNYTGTDNFINAGTLAKTGGTGTSELQLAVSNSGTVAAASGTLAFMSTLTNTGELLATGGGVLNLTNAAFSNLSGSTLTGGTYAVLAASVIELSNNTSITTDSASITLSGVGSAIQSLNTGTGKQISLDSKLSSITSSGALTLLNGRNYTSSVSNFTDGGLLNLGGVIFTAPKLAISAGGTASGYGTISATMTDAGTISASGGTLVLAGSLTGAGVLSATAGATVDLTAGGALTEAVSGAGTLQLDGATAYTMAGVTVGTATVRIDAGATLSGTGTLSGSVADAGTLLASGGTLVTGGSVSGAGALQAAAGATLDVSGGGSFAGTVSGAGTLQLDGGTPFSVQNSDLIVAAVKVDAGATLDLTGGGALGGTITGAGRLQLDGATAFTLAGGSVNVGSVTVDGGATLSGFGTMSGALADAGTVLASGGVLTLDGALSGSGALQAAASAVVDVTDGGTFTGAIGGAGTLRLDGAQALVLQAGASLTTANVLVDAGAILDLETGGSLGGSLAGAGTLQLDGTTAYSIAAGTTLGIGTVRVGSGATLSGAGIITGGLVDNGTVAAVGGKLVLSGVVSGTGALQAGSGATLDLTGGGALTEAISGAGTLELGNSFTLAAATIAAAVSVDAGASLSGNGTISGSVLDAGAVMASGGTLVLAGGFYGTGTYGASAGALLDLTTGGALSENFVGAGTLQLDGGTYTLSGGNIDLAAVTIDAGATLSGYGTIAGAIGGTGALIVASGATLDLTGGGALTQAISGSGTLELGNAFTISGETIGTALSVAAGAALSGTGTITSALLNNGSVSAAGGTLVLTGALSGSGTFGASAGAVLDLTSGGALSENFAGGGTLELGGATTYTVTGASRIGIAAVALDTGSTISGSGTISGAMTDDGTIIASGGKLVLGGALSGTGSLQALTGATLDLTAGGVINNAISGAGTLELGGAYTLGSGSLSMAALAIDAGASLSAAGTLSSTIADAGTLMATGGTLVLKGMISGSGTLAAESGSVLDIAAGGTFGGTLGGAGTVDIAAALTLTKGASLSAATIIETANVTLGSNTALVLADGSSLDITAAANKTVKFSGPGSASFTNAGSLVADGAGTAQVKIAFINSGNVTVGSGTLSFLGSVTNNGVIDQAGGELLIKKTVGGTGTLEVGSTGTLSLLKGAAAGQTVDFTSQAGGLLDLTKPIDFKGTIDGFGGSDQIDLLKTNESSYSYENGVLTIKDGSKTEASLHFGGTYTQSNFSVGSDGHGDTIITFTP